MDTSPLLILALYLLVSLALWLPITGLVSLLSGWRSLAKQYPYTEGDGVFEIRKTNFASLNIGRRSNYKGLICFVIYQQGLKIQTVKLYKVFHAPIYIPWSEVESYSSGPHYRIHRLEVIFKNGRKIRVFNKVAKAIEPELVKYREKQIRRE